MRGCWSKAINFQLQDISCGDLTYSKVMTANNSIFMSLKFAKRAADLGCCHHHIKNGSV